ncbi:GntR family transcriptional regulator [Arcanobacterium haemolyticum]|nr:GntR family transcriptional regulator [Arcanobacterium haemolyticum]
MASNSLDEPYPVKITIDRDSSVPLHTQVSEPISALILAGDLPAGQLLEDEVTLAARLHVSRPTVRRAFQDLVAAGLLTRRRGSGTRVTLPHIHRKVGLTSLYDDLKQAGLAPRTDVLSYEVSLADSTRAELLACEAGTEIVRIERLRWSNDEPLGIMTNILPVEFAPSFTDLAHHGLYQCLRDKGINLASATQRVGAKLAGTREAELLQLTEGSPLVTTERTSIAESGKIVEYGRHLYDANQYQVTFTLFAESAAL